jgi:hypothetical protein
MWGPGASSAHQANTFVTTQQNHQIIRTPFDIGFAPYSFEAILGFKLTHFVFTISHHSVPDAQRLGG